MAMSSSNDPGMHLQDLILDSKVTATVEQKIECLSLLKIVVRNLADPAKSTDPKFRQLRLSNEKVRRKLRLCDPSATAYLYSVGFVRTKENDGEDFLRVTGTVDVDDMGRRLLELTNALAMLEPPKKSSSSSSFVEEKKTPEGGPSTVTGKLSEKQKARILLEKKRKAEKEEAKSERARNVAMLKADKHTRMHDPNWKSGVSAACMKSGDGISTFRDKFGEN